MRPDSKNRSDQGRGYSLELRVPQAGTVRSGEKPVHPAVRVDLRVDGTSWKQVPTLEPARPEDRVFVVQLADDTARIVFGDGERGSRLPAGVNSVTARYRTGGGESLVYVDIWTTEVTALEDARLREPASGGPDTSTRK